MYGCAHAFLVNSGGVWNSVGFTCVRERVKELLQVPAGELRSLGILRGREFIEVCARELGSVYIRTCASYGV